MELGTELPPLGKARFSQLREEGRLEGTQTGREKRQQEQRGQPERGTDAEGEGFERGRAVRGMGWGSTESDADRKVQGRERQRTDR